MSKKKKENKMTETSQEVVETKTTLPADYDPNCLGAADDIVGSDLRVGILTLGNSSSKPCKLGEVRQGAWYDWETKEELGFQKETPVEVIIVSTHRFWIERENDNFKTRYEGTHAGEHAWEDGDITREFNHAFMVLLPKQIADGVDVPYELSFKSTGLKCSQKISKILMNMRRGGKASWAVKFKLTSSLVEHGGYSWFAPDVELGEATTDQEKASAYGWFKTLQNVDVNKEVGSRGVDEGEEEGNLY